MIKIPSNMNAHLSDAEARETETWWNELSEEAKIELNQLYNNVESGDKEAEENGVELIPIAVYGEFVEEEGSKRREWVNNDYWLRGFSEYMINHEIYFFGHIPYTKPVRHQNCSPFLSSSDARKGYFVKECSPYYRKQNVWHLPQLVFDSPSDGD